VERVKAMQRNATAAAEADRYRPELIADDEPRYLRRQKPVEIRRKKFGAKGWQFYRRVFFWTLLAAASIVAAYFIYQFATSSPLVLLKKPDQVAIVGNHIVSRDALLQEFVRDANRSVLQIPLDQRRDDIEQIPWVESASVQRILPNRIRVQITERTPVAFLRSGTELALIDAHGVILDRPEGEDFQFPIVSGVGENIARDERERRMQLYQEFMKDIDLVRSESSYHVSEVDLSNPKDFRAVMAGFPGAIASQAVTIRFGQGDFIGKYRMLVENFAQWQANAGCVQSVDLQFTRQVVLNPDANACGGRQAAKAH
jgi:cell division protein FtsQ